jgi:Domain of unknown function (DUF4388)
MSLTGYLSEYSLVEIFNFIQTGNKTGLLSIEPDRCFSRYLDNAYYISFQTGRIMSVNSGHGLENRGLLKLIAQRQWLVAEQITGLSFHASNLKQPLGTHLKSCNLLNTEQLSLLFDAQVVAGICKLFGEKHYGRFCFDSKAGLNYAEMTGISLPAKEISFRGLRMLRDWSDLTNKLPAQTSGLQRFSSEQPNLRLDTQESKVWNLAVGELSIAQIAAQLVLDISKVQQIGFRLIAIGLVQEISVEPPQPPINKMMDLPQLVVANRDTPPKVSASFLSRLVSFLNKKG